VVKAELTKPNTPDEHVLEYFFTKIPEGLYMCQYMMGAETNKSFETHRLFCKQTATAILDCRTKPGKTE